MVTETKRIYLDYAATSPMLDVAKQACIEGFDNWANPSSPHGDGRAAQAMLEHARRRFKDALGWEGDVIFTSGASEAIQIALTKSKPTIHYVSAVEHDVVLRFSPDAKRIPVGMSGAIVPANLGHLLESADSPALVAIQSVNNETGVIQDLDTLSKVVHDHGSYLLADCSQSVGKMPLPDADLIIVAGHKFGGPPGVGALLVKDLRLLEAAGGQEQGYRSGTQNLPYIMGMVAALEAPSNWAGRAMELRQHLDDAIRKAGGAVIADESPRIATIASYHMPGVAANTQLIKFDMAGFSVSAGSACSSGTLKTSHVLEAMGTDPQVAREVIRVSIGRDTSRTHIYAFIDKWQSIFAEARGS